MKKIQICRIWFIVMSVLLVAGGYSVNAFDEFNSQAIFCTADIIDCPKVGDTVSLGGMAFGVKMYTDGVLVCGVSEVDTENGNFSPGNEAGVKEGDLIKLINNTRILSVADVAALVDSYGGESIMLTIDRGGEEIQVKIEPVKSKSEGEYKLGLWIKDGTAGIGTVTYIYDESSLFAGLGHGICDIETGKVLKMREGEVCDVTVSGIKMGAKGDPGEIQGFFSSNTCGHLISNTEHGVFGKIDLNSLSAKQTAIIAPKKELHEGSAYILCTLDDNIICQYDIEIEKINQNSKDTKNFIIEVTDPELLGKTGGIVQGMSGSPIIQDEKLVGAVTHVLIDDPTRGYGIFIENMLNANA